MSRGKSFLVGSKTDSLSIIQLCKVLDSLREAHPRSKFIDFRDKQSAKDRRRNKGEVLKTLSGLLQLLMREEIDIVVADIREIPLRLQSKFKLAAVPLRGNPFDVLISREGIILDDQPEMAQLAVADPAKKGQLLYYRPDLRFIEETADFYSFFRIMEKGDINGFVIAASDVEALNKQDKVVEVFTSSICMPAPGQGALGLIVRGDDREASYVVKALDDPPSSAEIELERMLFGYLSRDGKGPVGVLVNVEGEEFQIEAAIVAPDGSKKVSGAIKGRSGEESKVVGMLADALLSSGGRQIIKNFKISRNTGQGPCSTKSS